MTLTLIQKVVRVGRLMHIGGLITIVISMKLSLVASEHPNVLFIAVDDLRPSIGCYGDAHAITPNIDALASVGVQFNHAYCQVAVCNPSRASLMTGLRPDKLGVWTLPNHFRETKPDAVTLPQWFRKFGYTAVSHGKIYHNPFPDPQSWSEPIRSLPGLPYEYPEGTRDRVNAARNRLPENDWRKSSLRGPSTAAPDLEDDEFLDAARTKMAIEDLRRLSKCDEPFFLAMGYIRPHLAWVAPKKYWDMHDPEKLPVLVEAQVTPNTPSFALANNSELTHYVDLIDFPQPWDETTVTVETARHLMHAYYACISYVDAQIGRLLEVLDAEGLRANTIVVLWSDHGWKLGEHRGWGKMSNYEIDARVPLIISAPGLNATGQQTDQLAELLDIFPTLCELSGIEMPNFVDGRSLKPILDDVTKGVHDGAINQYYRRVAEGEFMGYSIRSDEYRLVEWRNFPTGEVMAKELYDHRTEHSETQNIIDSVSPDIVKQLTDDLLRTHPRVGLNMTPAVHTDAAGARWQVRFGFRNRTDGDVLVYNIDSKGQRKAAARLKPNEQVTYNARIGGVFVVESHDGKIHEIHSPSFPARMVDILKRPEE